MKIIDKNINIKNYTIKKVDYWDLPGSESGNPLLSTAGGNITKLGTQGKTQNNALYNKDKEGIPCGPGSQGSHPIMITQQALKYIYSYELTGNEEYLNRVKKFIDKLLSLSTNSNGALYFPYNFNFFLHSNKTQKMIAPWYSGMAQGQILSLLVRTFNITKEKKYKKNADLVFNSFKLLKEDNNPWISYIDKNNYYWIEEYPMDIPCNTLNGFIFAIFGLYDYYLLSESEESKNLLQSSLTTIEDYLDKFTTGGSISLYCLKHRVRSKKYHLIHSHQLKMLNKLTGEEKFKI